MDLTSVTTLLGCIKTATELAKLIKDSGVTLEQAEFKLKLAELIGALADAKLEIAEIQLAVSTRDERIRDLENAEALRSSLRYNDPAYWIDSGGVQEGPYCQHCYDKDTKLIRMQDESDGAWECRACKNRFFEPSRRARDDAQFNAPLSKSYGYY